MPVLSAVLFLRALAMSSSIISLIWISLLRVSSLLPPSLLIEASSALSLIILGVLPLSLNLLVSSIVPYIQLARICAIPFA